LNIPDPYRRHRNTPMHHISCRTGRSVCGNPLESSVWDVVAGRAAARASTVAYLITFLAEKRPESRSFQISRIPRPSAPRTPSVHRLLTCAKQEYRCKGSTREPLSTSEPPPSSTKLQLLFSSGMPGRRRSALLRRLPPIREDAANIVDCPCRPGALQ